MIGSHPGDGGRAQQRAGVGADEAQSDESGGGSREALQEDTTSGQSALIRLAS